MPRITDRKELRPARLNEQQKQNAIAKIDRMINELKAFDPKTIALRSDPRTTVFENKLDKLLIDIFGHDTLDYERYARDFKNFDTAPFNLYAPIDIARVQGAIETSIKRVIAILDSIKQNFVEEIQDAESDKPSKILKAYNGLELHPDIAKVSNELYKDGHYAEAVGAAAKRLVGYVKEKSGVSDKDGSSLMQHVFNPKNPILKFNSLSSQSDKNQQQGYLYLFTGAVMAIRNPRAHENIVDDAEEALEHIVFISFLAKQLDKSFK